MSQKKGSIWTKDFILICLAGLATNICMRMLDSNLASFANEVWASKSLGGQLTSFFNVGSILMAFFAGRLVDMRGRRKMLMAFCILFAIPTVFMALVQVPGVALGARLIQGVAKGVVTVALASVVSDITPREKMNEGMGMFNLGSTASFAFGPMLGLALVDRGGYKLMFIVCAIAYAFGALFAHFIRYEDKQEKPVVKETVKEDDGEYKGVWKLIAKEAIPAALNNTIFFGSYAAILVFLTVFAQEILGLNSTQIGLFYTVAAVAMLAVRLLTAKVGDKYGPLYLIDPGHLIIMLGLLLLALFAKGNYIAFLVAGACYGVGQAITTPALNTCAVLDTPAKRSATANATFYFMMDFGILFASAGFGALIDASATAEIGYKMTFLISIGVCLFSMLLSICFFNNKAIAKRRKDQ